MPEKSPNQSTKSINDSLLALDITPKSLSTSKSKFDLQAVFTSPYASIFVTLSLLLFLFGLSYFIAYSYITKPKAPENYSECVKSKGSLIRESYPAVCVAKDGNEFIQQLSPEEQKLLEVAN